MALSGFQEEEEQVFIASAKGRNGPKDPYTPELDIRNFHTNGIYRPRTKGKSLSAQLCKNTVSYLILKKEMTAVAARKLTVFKH